MEQAGFLLVVMIDRPAGDAGALCDVKQRCFGSGSRGQLLPCAHDSGSPCYGHVLSASARLRDDVDAVHTRLTDELGVEPVLSLRDEDFGQRQASVITSPEQNTGISPEHSNSDVNERQTTHAMCQTGRDWLISFDLATANHCSDENCDQYY